MKKALLAGILLTAHLWAQDWFILQTEAALYPLLANQARIEGIVRLKLALSETGEVSDVKTLSGAQVLARAA